MDHTKKNVDWRHHTSRPFHLSGQDRRAFVWPYLKYDAEQIARLGSVEENDGVEV